MAWRPGRRSALFWCNQAVGLAPGGGGWCAALSSWGSRHAQSGALLDQMFIVGCTEEGSSNAPTRTAVTSGRLDELANNGDPHVGQKRWRIGLPLAAVRANSLNCPEISSACVGTIRFARPFADRRWQSRHQQILLASGSADRVKRTAPQRQRPVLSVMGLFSSEWDEWGRDKVYHIGEVPTAGSRWVARRWARCSAHASEPCYCSRMKTTTATAQRRGKAADTTGPRSSPRPTALIEAQLTANDEPVLGLYLHVAYHCFMASFEDIVGRGEITPNLIGVLALLARQPGLSQADLARVIGLERATVGVQVARAISLGFVSRNQRPGKGRRYELHLTRRGRAMLTRLRQRVPRHERFAGARLEPAERRQLRQLLDRLVYG